MSTRKENIAASGPRSSSPTKSPPIRSSEMLGDIKDLPSPSRADPEAMDIPEIVSEAGIRFLECIDTKMLMDGNVLRDFLGMSEISERGAYTPTAIANLGCGSGRVSFLIHKLLPNTLVMGLDDRVSLIEEARSERTAILQEEDLLTEEPYDEYEGDELAEIVQERLGFLRFDVYHESPFEQNYNVRPPRTKPFNFPDMVAEVPPLLNGVEGGFEAVVCSLFLDNVPLETFFSVAARIVGFSRRTLLITNMHPEARRLPGLGRALVVQEPNGSHRRPHVHSIEAIKKEAEKWEFKFVRESSKKISAEDVKDFEGASDSWIGVRCWFAIMFQLKKDMIL